MNATKPVLASVLLGTALVFAAAMARAADQGPRHHAEGVYDTATSTYQVVKGDDLDAIVERFGVTVAELKERNALHSDTIDADQGLVIAAATLPAGAPGATTTIDGLHLPNPPQPFGGDIQTNALQSKPAWPALITPPKGAPNVLLIMIDDEGFSAPSTFGGVIPTPSMDRVANMGLRYTRFHTTSLCSPTRAALLTGRNHHSAATGVVVDQATGFPGYDGVIPRNTAAIGEIMRLNGYDTSWFGKDHNTPQTVGSQAARSPTGRPGRSRASTTSTAFSATTPANGSRTTCSATPRRSSPTWASPAGT